MSTQDDITTLLQLYPKKLNRKAFDTIRSEYTRQTGHDLCEKIDLARKGILKHIDTMRPEQLPKDLRVSLFKAIDYEWAYRFCKRVKKR